MKLTEQQKRHLRGLAQQRKVLVIVGNAGLTESVTAEIDNTLAHHELVKVRINAADRESRQTIIEQIRDATASALVQSIGHVAVYYRPAETPKILLPR